MEPRIWGNYYEEGDPRRWPRYVPYDEQMEEDSKNAEYAEQADALRFSHDPVS